MSQELDQQIAAASAEKQRLAQRVGELQRSLKAQGSRKSKAQLQAEQAKLEADVAQAEATLQQKKAPAGAALSADVAEKVKKQYVMLHKEYRERKRKCMEVVDMLSENMGERPKKLCENLGFETDEDVGVDFKKFPVVRL